MYNILFLNMPNVSLFERRPGISIISGLGFLVGSLKKFELKHLDLNIALNNRRDFELLTEEEYTYLINPTETVPEKIDSYLNLLVDYVEEQVNLNDIKVIAYSLEGTACPEYMLVPSTVFIALFNNRLQQKLNKQIPSYVGGININSIEILHQRGKFPKLDYPTKFFDTKIKTVYKGFIEYLIINYGRDVKRPTRDTMVFDTINHNRDGSYSLPDNVNEFLFHPATKLPQELLTEFPNLMNVDPFVVGNYKYQEGCIFKCSFCAEHGKNGFYRADTIENIIDNIKRIEDQGVRYINFLNNNINTSLKGVYEFGNAMVKNNIKVKWTDSANLTIVDDDMFSMLAEAGCVRLWFGTENVSDFMLKEIGKKVNKEQIIQRVTQSHEAGIWNNLNFIVNLPREREEDLVELEEFLNQYWNKIIDGLTVNSFDLRPSSRYFIEREQYGIKVYDYQVDGRLYRYDEPDRLWEQIKVQGKERKDRMLRAVNIVDSNLFENADYMFYSMLEAYGSKQKIKEAIQFLSDNKLYREVALLSSAKLENHYKVMYDR